MLLLLVENTPQIFQHNHGNAIYVPKYTKEDESTKKIKYASRY
jgi:hypothetical protein